MMQKCDNLEADSASAKNEMSFLEEEEQDFDTRMLDETPRIN